MADALPQTQAPRWITGRAQRGQINSIVNDAPKLKQIRSRLSDISWWMRLLCQKIAVRANAEDDATGKFLNLPLSCVGPLRLPKWGYRSELVITA